MNFDPIAAFADQPKARSVNSQNVTGSREPKPSGRRWFAINVPFASVAAAAGIGIFLLGSAPNQNHHSKLSVAYFPSGRVATEMRSNERGQSDGLQRSWYGDGSLYGEIMFSNGTRIWSRTYYRSGRLWYECHEGPSYQWTETEHPDE
jgi:hypothetical protein